MQDCATGKEVYRPTMFGSNQGPISILFNIKSRKHITWIQGVAAKSSAVGFCLGCGLFGSYNSL